MNSELEQWLADFLERQEPLGADFQKILDENLWALLSDDEEKQ